MSEGLDNQIGSFHSMVHASIAQAHSSETNKCAQMATLLSFTDPGNVIPNNFRQRRFR